MARRTRTHLEDPAEIGLLASPTRIEIVDTLEATGGAALSVAELAQRLGRAADGLYYHLRQLANAGLVEEHDTPDGRRYRSRVRAGERLSLRYKPGATANAEAVARVAASALRVAERDFRRALADPATVVEGPHRELWAARGKGWVNRDDLAEINTLLARLMDLLQQPRGEDDDGRFVALAWVLAPLEGQPARRAAAETPARRAPAMKRPPRAR